MITNTISQNKQFHIFINFLQKVFEYPEYSSIQEIKLKLTENKHLSKDDLIKIVLFSSYVGSLIRIAYYKFVHKHGFDVRILSDACVKTFLFNGVYQFEFEPYIKRKEIKQIINKTQHPKWVKIGLFGGSIKEIKKLGDEFVKYMESVN